MFKRAFQPLLYLGAAVGLSSLAAAPPDFADARVTIPYAELKSLWEAAQAKVPAVSKPPVEVVLLSAHYQLAFQEGRVLGTAEFQTQSFAEHWTLLPLLGAGAQIESIEPADAQVIARGGNYALLTDRPGKQTVKIHFAAKLEPDGANTHLHLPLLPAAINTLTLSGIPAGQTPEIADAVELSRDRNTASFQLSARDGLDLDLAPEKSLAPPVPSRWQIEPQLFVETAEGKLLYDACLAASAEGGSGLTMDLLFPPGANISALAGDDLAKWQVSTAASGARIAHLTWKTRDLLRRVVRLSYDLPQPLTAPQWRIQPPQVSGGTTAPALCLVAMPPGLELTVPAETPVPRQMPAWMAERAAKVNFLALVGDAPIQARWLPLVPTTRAVVQAAHARMQVVADGSAMTELDYEVRHETALAWKLDLPPGSELLACSIDGAPVNPVNRGAQSIEFSLPAGKVSSQVKLSYTAKVTPFNPVKGQLALELPQTDLLTTQLYWEVHIPSAYEVAAFEGNVEPAGKSETDATSCIIHLHRELCEGQRPAAQLFYQKPEATP